MMGQAVRLATPLCLSLPFHLCGRSRLPLEDRDRRWLLAPECGMAGQQRPGFASWLGHPLRAMTLSVTAHHSMPQSPHL